MAERNPAKGKAKPAERLTTTDALDLALERDDDVARSLIGKHERLVDAQIRTERLEHRNKLALIAFRSILAAGALALIAGFGWMVLNARNDRGLVIEALSVPPDLAARGLTGEAMASNLADKLAEIDRTAQSFRSPETMTVNWGNDVKIQIPETGVSIGELDAFLRRVLGHQTIIGGAVFRTPQGLRLTVRVGSAGAVEQTGTDANLEAMVQKAAEGVFAETQPYRYSKYLEFKGRTAESMAVARQTAQTADDPKERAWAWAQISNLLLNTDTKAAIAAGYRAIREDDQNALAYLNTCIATGHLAHNRESKRLCDIAATLGASPEGGLSEIGVNTSLSNLAFNPTDQGDFRLAAEKIASLSGPAYPGVRETREISRGRLLLALHDVRGARRLWSSTSDVEAARNFNGGSGSASPNFDMAMEEGDYARAVALAREVLAFLERDKTSPHMNALQAERFTKPNLATALALDGQMAEARAITDSLPLDCATCDRPRFLIAALDRDMPAARRWLEAGLRNGNLPAFGFAALSSAETHAGEYEAALASADKALAAGPNFADAHKARGDALRKLRRYGEAVREYAKAAKIAPAWGRARVDWGIAEVARGDKEAARARFKEADERFLTPEDKRVLAAARRHLS